MSTDPNDHVPKSSGTASQKKRVHLIITAGVKCDNLLAFLKLLYYLEDVDLIPPLGIPYSREKNSDTPPGLNKQSSLCGAFHTGVKLQHECLL